MQQFFSYVGNAQLPAAMAAVPTVSVNEKLVLPPAALVLSGDKADDNVYFPPPPRIKVIVR
jgi:hypothetical protein